MGGGRSDQGGEGDLGGGVVSLFLRAHAEGEAAGRGGLGEGAVEVLELSPLFLLPLAVQPVLPALLGVHLVLEPVRQVAQDTHRVLHSLQGEEKGKEREGGGGR